MSVTVRRMSCTALVATLFTTTIALAQPAPAVGPGILVYTPIGPLSLAYGINVYRHSEYEDFGALQFSIGLF